MTLPPRSLDDRSDAAFRAFFQSRLPQTWPAAPYPALQAKPARAALSHGRLTLAASVAALFGLGAYLSYIPTRSVDSTDPSLLPNAVAKPSNGLEKHIFKDQQPLPDATMP